ncbi:MAG TPA: glycosyltransferase family 4 protein, partial [Gemmataceae bacterium]|nr:glycosyltransferase family 4 protein [Gemmataceae bacterium]
REKLTWFDRRFLRLVARVLVPHGAGADGLIRQGVPGEKIVEVAPAVADAPPLPDRDTFLRANDLPPDAKMIMSAGRMGTRLRLFDAVWAFEVLRYGDPAIHLVVVGDGPGREGMQRTAHSLAPEGTQTRFLGARSDTSALLGLADVVYVPNRAGGVNVALEAMAAGRAVVANKTPDLADVIRDGETGFLIPVGDHTATARRLWQILRDPVERARVGEAARRMVHDRHNVPTLVCAMEDIYGE